MTDTSKNINSTIIGRVISILLIFNGFLLASFYNTSISNDADLLARVMKVEAGVKENNRILEGNKDKYLENKRLIDVFHPRVGTIIQAPINKDIPMPMRLKLEAILSARYNLKENRYG